MVGTVAAVRGLIKAKRAAFVQALCAGNPQSLAAIRDGSDNDMAKVRAVIALEEIQTAADAGRAPGEVSPQRFSVNIVNRIDVPRVTIEAARPPYLAPRGVHIRLMPRRPRSRSPHRRLRRNRCSARRAGHSRLLAISGATVRLAKRIDITASFSLAAQPYRPAEPQRTRPVAEAPTRLPFAWKAFITRPGGKIAADRVLLPSVRIFCWAAVEGGAWRKLMGTGIS